MADIFISYARPDRELAEKLARSLEAQGYQVWWDTELVGSDDFRDLIFDELTRAKAVIVIWSENSVRSKFVRDEAGRADRKNKLISTCKDGFDMESLPMGFGERHCHPVRELDQTLKALARLGVRPADQKSPFELRAIQKEADDWEKVRTSADPKDYKNYLRTYPNGLYRASALAYLRRAGQEAVFILGRGIQLLVAFAIAMIVVSALLAVLYGNQAPPGVGPVALVAVVFLTWLVYRWWHRRPPDS